jgi:hypothetical protein
MTVGRVHQVTKVAVAEWLKDGVINFKLVSDESPGPKQRFA